MGLDYQLVLWNKQKKRYDLVLFLFIVIYLLGFAVVTFTTNANTSLETLIIRAFGSLAILMLHIILMIGPLTRIDKRFMPLLYNRRHFGVLMFLMAAVHGVFSIIQFHTLGNVNPIVSIFTSNLDYNSLTNFPFQVLGFLALIILFLMAATSHDFWLANLSAKTWKALHMAVYLAYTLVILHIFLGAFQQETSPLLLGLVGLGATIIVALHIFAGFKEVKVDQAKVSEEDGWHYVCSVEDIKENRAKMTTCAGERVAIFKYEGKLSAVHNVCRHQGGPLGEGKIVDGCITCPWHGYQYLPGNGQSPPPFTEKVETYNLKLVGNKVYIDPKAHAPGTPVDPIKI